MTAEWQQREDARRYLRAEPHNSNLRKVVKMAGKNLRTVRKAAVLGFWAPINCGCCGEGGEDTTALSPHVGDFPTKGRRRYPKVTSAV